MILLLDAGKAKAGQQASDRVNRGEQVLVVNLILTGEAQPRRRNASDSHRYAQLLATVGDRPLEIRASHVLVLLGATLDPTAFSEVRIERGMKSLSHMPVKPVRYSDTPELICLGLYPEFDLERLVLLALPTPMEQRFESSDSGD